MNRSLRDRIATISRRDMLKATGALVGTALVPAALGLSATTVAAAPQNAPVGQQFVGKRYGIGYVLSNEQWPIQALVDQAVAAEAAGFDLVWTSDHFHPWQDNESHSGHAWVLLGAVSQRTKNLTFGTGVTAPTFRHRPAIVAQAFASLGILAPGRVFLGVGTGEALNEQASGNGWGRYQERAERLAEAVQLIKQLWSGEWVRFEGKHYQIPKAKLYDIPQIPVPLYIAGSGPKAFALAGTYGDGWITEPKNAINPQSRGIWEFAARGAGKEPNTMPILTELFVFVGNKADPELQPAAELWRFLPKAWTKFVNNPDPVAIQQEADKIVPIEEVLSNWIVSEDPQEFAARIQALFDGGATQIIIHSAQKDQQKVIEFFGKQVLPLVRSKISALNGVLERA